jgi:hypothetical protein
LAAEMTEKFNPYLHGLGEMPVGDLVRLVALADGAVETEEIEWKAEWPLDSRPRRAGLAKHIIGLANRDPDRAAATFSGHGFILIGMEPGAWGQAPELDPAELVQQLEPFVGASLGWHPIYVNQGGHRVLVIVVDPPQWGDPIYKLERGSLDPESGREMKQGTVFVRRPGITSPANQQQIEALEARAAVPRPELTVVGDWNLGASGNYLGVNVTSGPIGRRAVLREVGFTLAGACNVDRIPGESYPPGIPPEALAYASLPITEEDHVIEPGQHFSFRVSLGTPPFFFNEDTELFPYVYFDDGHWLVGNPSHLIRQLMEHGWAPDSADDAMFLTLRMNFVWPESVADQKAIFALSG